MKDDSLVWISEWKFLACENSIYISEWNFMWEYTKMVRIDVRPKPDNILAYQFDHMPKADNIALSVFTPSVTLELVRVRLSFISVILYQFKLMCLFPFQVSSYIYVPNLEP